jgi:hypothetical protein
MALGVLPLVTCAWDVLSEHPMNWIDKLVQHVLTRFPGLARIGFLKKLYVWGRVLFEAEYVEDRMITCQTPRTFMEDPAFLKAYQAGQAAGSWGGSDVRWRVHVLCWAARQALSIEGDFVECGVNRGGYSSAVMNFTGFRQTGRRFFLLDSFEGMPEAYVRQKSADQREFYVHYRDCYEEVKARFKDDPVVLVKGVIPESLSRADVEKVAFMSIDLNFAEPEIAALEYFWPRLQVGGIVVFDDHGFRGFEAQRAAHVAFAQRHNVPILALPTGQAVLIKGSA